MTGLELLEGLSFVDERFIAEADGAVLGKRIPWMKVLSVAACLCILIVGAFTLENMGHKSVTETAAPAAPAAMEEAAPKQESAMEDAALEMEEVPTGELQHIPYAGVRIVSVLEDGSFEVIVEEVSNEPTPLAIGMELTMIIDPNMVPGADKEIQNDLSEMVADVKLAIEDGAYDAGINTLYVAGVFAVEE